VKDDLPGAEATGSAVEVTVAHAPTRPARRRRVLPVVTILAAMSLAAGLL
jgi:hypothetical protein